ncbi:ribosomal biogenesis protein LAS1L-like isoform X1 [Haliotis rubra]|uniref:ribosomal biogenesis protein LAS1L-like isoform X1 n=1 Tax=Haliotis rubra TaxID=36100 RepID=UPI001EE54FA4|nr:ribosomal biogenesis protein LAS1L-like isoform X1 [Haliotis rubra]
MAASMNKHVVPWICRDEFVSVYRKLYSEKTAIQHQALEHIVVWKTRCDSQLPVSVNCTADLISAQIDHRLYLGGSEHLTEYKVRQGYALALIRCVNFITDHYQLDRNNVAVPIHRIGEEIGIPEWIVSLRHEGTHRAMPSLDVLSRGTMWAVDWLKHNFWERQLVPCSTSSRSKEFKSKLTKSLIKSVSNRMKSYKKIRFQTKETSEYPVMMDVMRQKGSEEQAARLIIAYQQIRFQELAGKTFDVSDLQTGDEGQKVLQEMKKLLSVATEGTLVLLLEPGCLLPTEEQLTHMGIASDCPTNNKLAWVLAVFWRPLLLEINNLRLTSSLVEHLASAVSSETSHWNRLVHVWLQTLVCPYTISFPSGRSESLFSHQVALCELPLLQKCLQHPNIYTHDLLTAFASRENALLTEDAAERLNELIQILLRKRKSMNRGNKRSRSIEEIPEVQVLSVADLLQDNSAAHIKAVKRPHKSQWKKCSASFAWQHVPVGILPGQDVNTLYQDLDLDAGDNVQGTAVLDVEQTTSADQEEADDVNGQTDNTMDTVVDGTIAMDTADDMATPFSWSHSQLELIRNKLTVL